MNAAVSRIVLEETSCTFSTNRHVRNASDWASAWSSWRKSPMTNCLAAEPWLLVRQSAAARSGRRVIGRSADRKVGSVLDRPMIRSPYHQSFFCFLCEASDLGFSSFLVPFEAFVSLESFASLSSAELLSPSEEADEDDPAEPAPFFG